jgi:type VI protein secretion system component VasK
MAEDAGDAALRYRRAARKYVVGFLALLLGFLLSAFLVTRIGPPELRAGVDWAAVAALVAAFGTLATGIAAFSNLILARRAERREPDLKIRQHAHRAQELEAKKPREGSGA